MFLKWRGKSESMIAIMKIKGVYVILFGLCFDYKAFSFSGFNITYPNNENALLCKSTLKLCTCKYNGWKSHSDISHPIWDRLYAHFFRLSIPKCSYAWKKHSSMKMVFETKKYTNTFIFEFRNAKQQQHFCGQCNVWMICSHLLNCVNIKQ